MKKLMKTYHVVYENDLGKHDDRIFDYQSALQFSAMVDGKVIEKEEYITVASREAIYIVKNDQNHYFYEGSTIDDIRWTPVLSIACKHMMHKETAVMIANAICGKCYRMGTPTVLAYDARYTPIDYEVNHG